MLLGKQFSVSPAATTSPVHAMMKTHSVAIGRQLTRTIQCKPSLSCVRLQQQRPSVAKFNNRAKNFVAMHHI
jgi:hypothetical protein